MKASRDNLINPKRRKDCLWFMQRRRAEGYRMRRAYLLALAKYGRGPKIRNKAGCINAMLSTGVGAFAIGLREWIA